MPQVINNNVASLVSGSLTNSSTSITLQAGHGFPNPASNYYLATLVEVDGSGREVDWEIVRVTALTGDVLTVVRGQEGTAARSWGSLTVIEMRVTAGTLVLPDATQTLENKTLVDPVVTGSFTSPGIDDNADATTLTITAAERLGVNEASPDARLHVNSGAGDTVAILESTDGNAYLALRDTNTTNDVLVGATGDDFRVWTGNAEAFRVTSAGRMGLGTDTPDSVLEIEDGSYAFNQDMGLLMTLGNSDATNYWRGGLRLKSNGSGVGRITIDGPSGVTGGTDEIYSYTNTGGGEHNWYLGDGLSYMTLAASGFVAIGGDFDPITALHVRAADATLTLQDTAGSVAQVEYRNSSGDVIANTRSSGTDFIVDLEQGGSYIYRRAGTEEFRINGSGYMGLQVSDPTHPLDVLGPIRLRGAGASTELGDLHLYWVSDTNRATWTTTAQGDVVLETGLTSPAERLRVDSDGKTSIGTGTVSTEAQLHIENPDDGDFGRGILVEGTSNWGRIDVRGFGIASGSEGTFYQASGGGVGLRNTNDNSNLDLIQDGAGGIRFSINGAFAGQWDSGGGFVIGGTTAARKLHAISAQSSVVKVESTTTAAYVEFGDSSGDANRAYVGSATGDFQVLTGATSATLALQTDQNHRSAFVGEGTESDQVIYVDPGRGTNTMAIWNNATDQVFQIGNLNAVNTEDLDFYSNGTGRIRFIGGANQVRGQIFGGGDVNFVNRLLIGGTTSGGTSLQGAVLAQGYNTKAGTGVTAFAQTNAFNISWVTPNAQLWIDNSNLGTIASSSDYRIKRNIEDMVLSGVDRVNLLRPVSYQWGDYGDLFVATDEVREGFIAHEVQEVIPSGAEGIKDDPDQIQSLRVDAILAVAVKAIQELSARVEELEAR